MSASVKSPDPQVSRATRRRERTRRAILDAAKHLAATRGPDAMTVADIAAAADIGVGTFYYHFQTRDDVLAALMDELLQTVSRVITEERESHATVRDRVRAGYLTFLTLSRSNRELFRVYFRSTAARAGFAEAARQYFLEDTRELIEEGQASGELRRGDADMLAHWMFGASHATLQQLSQRESEFDPEEEAAFLTDLLFAGLAPQ